MQPPDGDLPAEHGIDGLEDHAQAAGAELAPQLRATVTHGELLGSREQVGDTPVVLGDGETLIGVTLELVP